MTTIKNKISKSATDGIFEKMIEYVAENYKDKVLEKIGGDDVLKWISNSDNEHEIDDDDILNAVANGDSKVIADWLNSYSKISGYMVIKTENLDETFQVEALMKRMGKL